MITYQTFTNFKNSFSKLSSENITDFHIKLDDLKNIYESFVDNLIYDYKGQINKLGEIITKAKPEIDKWYKENSPNYNVFKILGLENKEVTTHTPFIENLLSPNGSHNQNTLFLNSFLDYIKQNKKLDDKDINSNDIKNQYWHTEKGTEYVDLRIANNNFKKAIFIENKIYSDAHDGQLSHYFKKWKEEYTGGGAFIYLSINGKNPNKEGYDENYEKDGENFKYRREIIERELKTISYKEDIKSWLENLIDLIESETVKFTIKQYLKLIELL